MRVANMRSVSELSGVSLSSVSRILANDPHFRVRDNTRRRVLDAARQLGYQYEARPREALKKIGCILSFTAERYMDKYFLNILSAIEKRLSEAGFSISTLSASEAFDKTAETIKREALSGLILFNDDIFIGDLEKLKKAVPHIVGVDTDFNGIDNVNHDHYRTGVLAMEHLLERGHRRIAYIGGDDQVLHGRECAFTDIMAVRGFPVPPGYIMDCGWEPERCRDMILDLCAREDRPTAIFAGSDNLAIAVLSALHVLGLSVPRDIAIVGVNNLDFSAFTSPPLTTVSIPMEEIGCYGAELLLQRINGFVGLPIKILFPTTLIIRNST